MGRKRHKKTDNEETKKNIKPTVKEKKEVKEETKPVKEEVKEEIKETSVEETKIEATPEKKKCKATTKLGAVLMLFMALVIIVGGLFFAYLSVKSPKAVYTRAINKAFSLSDEKYKEYSSTYGQFNILEDVIVVDTDFKLSTNMEDLIDEYSEIEDVNFSGHMGLDYKNNQIQLGGTIKGEKEELTAELFTQGKKTLLSTNIYERLIDMTDDTDIYDFFREFKKLLDEEDFVLGNLSYKDYHYLSTTVEKALIKSLETGKMSKESAEFEILDEEIKGTKYTYTIDSKTYAKMTKSITTTLLNDKKFIKKASEAFNIDKDKIVDMLKEIRDDAKETEIDKLKVNIYTSGIFEEIRGIEFYSKDEDDFENSFAIFTKDDNYEIKIVDYDDEFKIKAEKEDDEYKVRGKYEGETILTATVKELSPSKVDLKFVFEKDDTRTEGIIYLDAEADDDKLSLDYKIEIEYEDDYLYDEEQYFKSEGKVNIEKVDKLPEKEVKDPIDVFDIDEDELYKNMKQIVENDPVLNNMFGYLFVEELEDPASDFIADNLMSISEMYQVRLNVGLKEDDYSTSAEASQLSEDEIVYLVVSNMFDREQQKCFSVYKEDEDKCVMFNDDDFYDSIGYRNVYTWDEVKNIAKVNFGRDIDFNKLNIKSDEYTGETVRCNGHYSYCVTEYEGETYVYSISGGFFWHYNNVKVDSITPNGNIYTIVITEEDDENEKEFQVEFQFELLNDKPLSKIDPLDIRFISIKVI